MDLPKLNGSNRSEDELRDAMQVLASTIREAGECLLDLQLAVETLHLANQPALAQSVSDEAADCLRQAMRR